MLSKKYQNIPPINNVGRNIVETTIPQQSVEETILMNNIIPPITTEIAIEAAMIKIQQTNQRGKAIGQYIIAKRTLRILTVTYTQGCPKLF